MRPTFRWLEDVLTEDECKEIIEKCSSSLSTAGYANEDKKWFPSLTRKCEVSWIASGHELDPIIWKVIDAFRGISMEFYDIPLGRIEQVQYTDYPLFGHYRRHSDSGDGDSWTRIMSASIQLSDPSEYKGGDLKIYFGKKCHKSPKKRGLITVFPSIIEHKVTPLYWGRRRSLVMWGHIRGDEDAG